MSGNGREGGTNPRRRPVTVIDSTLDPPDVPADDRGFLLGDGLFETVRLYRGRPFRLDAHLDRLIRGASQIGIELPPGYRRRVLDAVQAWHDRDAALRITLTRGRGSGLAPAHEVVGRIHIAVRSWKDDPELLASGLRARILGRIDERSLVATLKALGYLERIQALRLARREGADEALLRNVSNRVVEGSASNLFAFDRGRLVAPGAADGALPGITREVVLEVARELGIEVDERGIETVELARSSDVFLSSSVRGLVPVVQLEGAPVGSGRPGAVFDALRRGFDRVVQTEIDGVGRETG